MNKKALAGEKTLFEDFEKLSQKRKKEVADFITYLRIREELEATKEIIRNKDFFNRIMQGDEDFKLGRFRRWSEVREDV